MDISGQALTLSLGAAAIAVKSAIETEPHQSHCLALFHELVGFSFVRLRKR
jgi:hypothetical protein